ncbi:MAG: leucine-rich repeat domain-containing protein [Verrucomicrobia bacterium]|nr:leucine-rich repeat domain-containing protein [Verrucomicrobiota bacterium]
MACESNWNKLPNELIVSILEYNIDPRFREIESRTNRLILSCLYPDALRELFNEVDQHPMRDSVSDQRIYALLSPTAAGGEIAEAAADAQVSSDFQLDEMTDPMALVDENSFEERLRDPSFVISRIEAVSKELMHRSEEISDPKARMQCQEAIQALHCSVALQAMRHFENQSLITFVGFLSGVLGGDFQNCVTTILNKAVDQKEGTEELAHAFRRLLREFQPQLDSIQYLDLSNCRLTSVPPEIGMLRNLVILDLNRNKLTCLPHEIGELKKLVKLTLSNNQISEIPSEFGQLTQLRELYLDSNKLEMVPPGLLAVEGLEILNLNSNRITGLPEDLGQLKVLKEFHAANNKISALPHSIGGLLDLQQVDLRNNQIEKLPDSFRDLKSLRALNLTKNQVYVHSCFMRSLPNLKNIKLDSSAVSRKSLACRATSTASSSSYPRK